VESANVTVAAMLLYQNGDKRILPALSFEVIAPESPITVVSPESEDLAVNTSIYPLEVQVVPGSTVTVNGKDVTDIVDQAGFLSVNVNVYPIGDNTYTIIVDYGRPQGGAAGHPHLPRADGDRRRGFHQYAHNLLYQHRDHFRKVRCRRNHLRGHGVCGRKHHQRPFHR
jgi:hypothetical protein